MNLRRCTAGHSEAPRFLQRGEGSPVLDIKPVFVEFTPERASIRQPAWAHEMMADYFASGERR